MAAVSPTTGLLTLGPKSRAAGDALFRQSWFPDGAPRAALILAHGYAEHAGRYQHLAERLTASGYAVHAIDHWGHGRSDGDRGFVADFSVFLDGMNALLTFVRSSHPDLPLFLLGHSMGGLIASHHLLTHQQHYCGAILSGPAVSAGTPPSAPIRVIGQILSRLVPKAGLLQLDAHAVSRDPEVVAAYLADHLVYKGKMSARLAAAMLRAMEEIQLRAGEITLPLLVIHGSKDTLAAPEGARQLVTQARSTDKQFRELDGLFHEVFNEPEREIVLSSVVEWITAHLP